jgi:DNA-binding transcriptional ArsR family regulator
MMFSNHIDTLVKTEVESVAARRIILDQLEGGRKTGTELRESIRKNMMAEAVQAGMKDVKSIDFKVTDPKLYFNTKHLEDQGIIVSRKDSQQRIFELHPRAIQSARRALGISRPGALITSIAQPEEARPLILWFVQEMTFNFKSLRLVVQQERFTRGVSKNIDRYVPDGTTKKWQTAWHELPVNVAGYDDGGKRGDLMATYAHVEKIILEVLPEYEPIVNLSTGPSVILLALCLIAMQYSLTAIYIQRPEGERTAITHIVPGEGMI